MTTVAPPPPMMPRQTVTSLTGKPLWAKYKDRFHSGPIIQPLHRQLVLLAGWPACGKSTAVSSIPRCCHIDSEDGGADRLPTVQPDNERITVKSWGEYEELVTDLEEDAKSGSPSFDVVAIDTLDSLGATQQSLAAAFILERASTGDRLYDVIAQFGGIGGTGWNQLAELATRPILRLRFAGYGVVAACHMRRKLHDGKQEITRDLTGGVERFLRNRCSLALELGKVQRSRPVTESITIPGGKTVETVKDVEQLVYFASFSSLRGEGSGMEELCKGRGLSGQFEFGPTDFWTLLTAKYNEATKKLTGGNNAES